MRHVEELDLGHGLLGMIHDVVARSWFARSVAREVSEIGRLLEAGERGRGPDHDGERLSSPRRRDAVRDR